MSSKAVTKAVAKKLKYYVDIKRLEDGFDLSGPYLPKQDPVPLRPGPTLAYDGLHDRSLKHYFKSPEVKRQVEKMTVPVEKSSRELEIRQVLDTEMAKRSYKLKSEYVSTTQRSTAKHRPQALISVDEYLRTKKGSQQRKVRPDVVGKLHKIARRSPPRHVCKNEHERLVNMAARLIVATEKAALPGNRSLQTKQDSLTHESPLPEVNSKCNSYAEDSSDTEIDFQFVSPRPPSRAGGPRPKWASPRSPDGVQYEQRKGKLRPRLLKSSAASSDTSEDIRVQVKNGKVFNKKSNRFATRPHSAGHTVRKSTMLKPSLSQSRYRSQSAVHVGDQWSIRQNGDNVVNGGQNECRKGAQKKSRHRGDEERVPDSKLFYKRSRENTPTSRYRVLTYEVYVVTGNRREASTDADVKLTLFGDSGSSGERCLSKSMNHSRKFRKGQVDIFPIDSVYLGELQNIRIGHTQTSPGNGWFLEKVFVSEGTTENRAFEFPCKRWFSSQRDDGQIIRDLSVSQLITESELTDKLDDYVNSAEQTSDEKSDMSYMSLESYEQTKEVEEKRTSEEEEEIPEKESREKPRRKDKKAARESGKKARNGGTKTVSFEKKEEKESEEEKRNSEDEVRDSESDMSEKNGNNNMTRESNSEDEDTEVKKTEGEDAVDKKTEGEDAEGKKTEEEDAAKKSSEYDDFWSNSSDKGEPIHYDLGINGNDDEVLKNVENSSSGSSASSNLSSSDNNPKNSDNERTGNEEHTNYGKQSRSGEGSGDERTKQGRDDNENKDEMAGTPENETVKEVRVGMSEQDSSEDYMAGFLAGVRTSEHENQQNEEQQHDDDTALNDSMDDGDFIMRKGPSLHSAVATGNVERVKELLQHNPSLREQTDEKGWTSLHIGCANGQLECTKVITLSGGDLEQETPTGYTSMHLAAMNGHVNCMMILFGLGAAISCRTIDEYTPLHLAAMSGHVECVKWLLANRVKHDVTDVNGRTPTEIAKEYCHEEVSNLLRSFGKEMKRTDSTLAHLMTYEGYRKKSTDSATSDTPATYSKIADSGVGGLGSGEESWVSDNDDEDEENEGKTVGKAQGRPTSARRVSSARSDDGSTTSMNRTDSITSIKEKQELYKKQRQQMKKRNSSFLDSIRMDVEDDFNDDS